MPLPPVPSVLQNQLNLSYSSKANVIPNFSSLYRYITSTCLDANDASTRSTNEIYEKSGVSQRLRDIRIQKVTENIIVRALGEICVSRIDTGKGETDSDGVSTGLTNDLRELGYMISVYLSTISSRPVNTDGTDQKEVDEGMDDLLADEIEEFMEKLPKICVVLEQYITDMEETIKSMADVMIQPSPTSTEQRRTETTSRIPKATSSNSSRAISDRRYEPTLSTTTSASLISIDEVQQTQNLSTLSDLLTQINLLISNLSTQHTKLLQSRIRTLEQHTHSALSRNLTTQASFLSTVSQGISMKLSLLSLLHEKEIYAEDGLRPALNDRFNDLTVLDRNLDEREHRLRALLDEYDSLIDPGSGKGEEIMRRLGTEYARVEEEIEVIKQDVRRLETGEV